MARGVNKVILVANLGQDPETKYAQGGSAVTKFSVATSESWKDRQSGETHDRTEWHNCVAFGRLAEIAGEYLRKGSKVYLEGKLQTSSWEKDGVRQYRTEVNIRELQMLDSKGQSNGQQTAQQQAPALAEDDFDSDIPFAFLLGAPFLPMLIGAGDVAKNVF